MFDEVIADVQGFKDSTNNFIVKEFAFATPQYTQTFLIKPPYPYCNLTRDEKKQVNWLEHNRGYRWSEGYIDYREFRRFIKPYLVNKIVFVKGLEKTKWVKELCNEASVVDIASMGCPNLETLFAKYVSDKVIYNCWSHKKFCALKSVICIKNWYLEYSFNKI